jgi:hypothetical protein
VSQPDGDRGNPVFCFVASQAIGCAEISPTMIRAEMFCAVEKTGDRFLLIACAGTRAEAGLPEVGICAANKIDRLPGTDRETGQDCKVVGGAAMGNWTY